MSRSRNIKPGFFKNDLLGECGPIVRLLFIGLWCEADREGRLEFRPKKLKAEIFPYDDVDIIAGLADLEARGFVRVYSVDSIRYIQIMNWGKHQKPHHKEAPSTIPAMPEKAPESCMSHGQAMHDSCMDHGSTMENASCPTDSGLLIVDSGLLIPDSLQKQVPGADAPEVPKADEPELPPAPPHNRLTDYHPPQVKDPLWHTGLAFLQKKSIPEDQARKFLGKLKREIGDIRAGALLAEAEAQDITDPIPWLSASAMKAKNTPAVGKTMQALQALEALKNGLADSGNSDGISKTALLEFGADTGGGGAPGNGRRLG